MTDECSCDDSAPPGCSPFTLTDDSQCAITGIVNEHLEIGGAVINVFKLLGIYEQHKLVDLTGEGTAISSGEFKDFPAQNAFDNTLFEWRSTQKGPAIANTSYVGYDFGPIYLEKDRLRYGIDTNIRHHVTSFAIRQGCNPQNRATKLRIERSDDNKQWFGVDIVDLPDTDERVVLKIRQSAPNRYWRFRAIAFAGSADDRWVVKELELMDYGASTFKDVQMDYGFLENRARQYSKQVSTLKGFYQVLDPLTEFSRFGIDMGGSTTYSIKIAFDTAVRVLGRPVVIGDIFELPSEIQYTPDLTPVRKYLEVTDVGWASEGYTPGWKPTIQRISASPMYASEETRDIVGNINPPSTDNDFFNLNNVEFDMASFQQDASIRAQADDKLPERGTDTADIHIFSEAEIQDAAEKGVNLYKIMPNDRSLYTADALPPNGLPYTEGTTYPNAPKDGAYHRLTYEGTYKGGPIPPRLFRWSKLKNRWIFLEEDERMRYNHGSPHFQMLADPKRVSAEDL